MVDASPKSLCHALCCYLVIPVVGIGVFFWRKRIRKVEKVNKWKPIPNDKYHQLLYRSKHTRTYVIFTVNWNGNCVLRFSGWSIARLNRLDLDLLPFISQFSLFSLIRLCYNLLLEYKTNTATECLKLYPEWHILQFTFIVVVVVDIFVVIHRYFTHSTVSW